jgi:hypothetical protein
MKIELAIIGRGAVTPAGAGPAGLVREPVATPSPTLGPPKEDWPVFRVDPKLPELVRWQSEPRLRRASPLTYFIVEAARQALGDAPAEARRATGLIVAFSAGCLLYSRRFYETIIKTGPRAASPALFPETVFNSPVSHAAAVLGLEGAAYALVGDQSAWVAALKTAAIWLRRGRVREVVVLGAEEFDPLVLDAYRSARWLRRAAGRGVIPAEGAAGVRVRLAGPGDEFIIREMADGAAYRTPAGAAQAARELLGEGDLPVYPSAERTWFEPIERAVLKGRPTFGERRPYLGEAFTASAAWTTLRALAAWPAGRALLPVWGLNQQVARLEIERHLMP